MESGPPSHFAGGSDEVALQDCDVCMTQNITSGAVSFCSICCEYLCQSCDKAHRGSRATRDHTLLTGNVMPTGSTGTRPLLPIMFCDFHKTMTLDYHCKSHDDVICATCKMTSHTSCETEEVSNHTARNDISGPFQSVVQTLSLLLNKFDSFKKARDTDRSSLKTQVQGCFNELKQLRKKINDKMDMLEKKLASEIRVIETKIDKEIDDHMNIASDILRQIGDQRKSLSECQKTQDDDVMFIGMKKGLTRAGEYENILINIQKDVYQIGMRLNPSEVVTDMIQQLQSLGTVDVDKPTSVLNMSIKNIRSIDVESSMVFASTFMRDGHLVLSCGKDGLKVFDKDFQFRSQLAMYSEDVSAINDTDVIITRSRVQQLIRVQVLPSLQLVKKLGLDRICEGACVFGDEIYVTCHDDKGNGEIQVLNMDGNVRRKISVNIALPNYIKVNRNGNKIFVSDCDSASVICINKHGHVIYNYTDLGLSPFGMYVDDEDNLLLCDKRSRQHNVHVVRADGSKQRVFLSGTDGISNPMCIAYRQADGCLVVGGSRKNTNLLIIRVNQA